MSNTDTAHARSIPWDCSDWQAAAAVDDAEDARVSVILESLAANRGKTLYCAVDQSDTFTKTETWQAGRDRNERDDTVYYGENGRFRGFLAAQEGYLTDGESGVTGISRERIFEFPEEQRRRKKTIKRRVLPPNATELVWSEWGGNTPSEASVSAAITAARNRFTDASHNPHWIASIPNARYGPNSKVDWPTLMREQGVARCRAIGYQRVIAVAISPTDPTDPTISWDAAKTNTALAWRAANLAVIAEGTSNDDALAQAERAGRNFAVLDLGSGNGRGWARQSFPYTVTCEKTVIRRRR